MRRPLVSALLLLAACQRAPETAQRAQARPADGAALRPVLVELFTSQGCSSCPPADAFLDRLQHEPNIVAISRHVTWWDRLGWRDTLARQEDTERQRAYAARHGDEAYTPQAVVQGRVLLIGGREGAVHRAIDEYRAAAGAGPSVRLERGALVLDGAVAGPAEIRLVALRSRVRVAIGGGENVGRTYDYVNVVVAETPLGTWRGGRLRLPLAPGRLRTPGADRHAVIVQEPGAGQVLAAGFL
ncbi:MAG TPA: DUF1223 domain-containing protein [Allosphingosinicella sp.]|nr:DUF1223 domain-containing protein [Allosphingosinicella sp.]